MKRTSKILFLFIAIFSILFLAGTSDVFAVANYHIAWRKDINDDGKPDLIFRRYRTATPEEVKEYLKEPASGYLLLEDGSGYYAFDYDSVRYPSKWVEPDANGVHKPSTKEYTTIGFSFHTELTQVYDTVTEGTSVGSMVSYAPSGALIPITNTVANSLLYFNNVSSKIIRPDILADGEVMESIPSLIYELYSNKGAINKVEFGTRWNISTVQPKNRVVYRYAIVQAMRNESGTLDEEYIYIEDCVMYHDDLLEFRATLDDSEWDEDKNIFISDIVISAAQYDDGGFELARTAAEFFKQYKKRGITREFWPIDVLGTAEDATRAVMNSFDNVITIPKKSKRNVYIRHVGIGEHTSLTTEALRSAVLLEANNPQIEIREDFNSEYETITATEVWDNHIEVYEGEIEIHEYLRKAANEYTGANNYVAIGYNIAGGYSFDDAYNMLMLEEYLGIMSSEASNVIEIDGLIKESESECVIIEFYYTKKPEIVYVNHLYVDVNNKVLPAVKQQIRGNDTAFTGTLFTVPLPSAKQPYYSLDDDETTINRIQERYYRQAGQSILVRTAVSLLDERFSILHLLDGVRYVGYQKYSSYRTLESLYGTKVDPSKDWYKPFDTILGVIVEPGTKQVNFYYYNQDKTEATIPDKFISMNYYFKSTQDNEGDCLKESNDDNLDDGNPDNDEKILSIPSGVNVKTGLTELSKVMVSAVNLEYIDAKNNKHDVDIKLQYNVGKDKTTINIDNVQYSFSYFRVDELIVDTLQKVTLFDASEKWTTTNGSPLFKWTNDKKEVSFSTDTPSLEVKGVKTIDTSDYKNTKDWTNYFGAKIKDNKGNTSVEDAEDLSISHQFLSQSQMDEVDANGDGKINAKDKTEAEKKENKLANTVENIEKVNEYTLRKYEEKKAQYEEAREKYLEAKNSSELMAAVVATVQGEKDKATAALNTARNTANTQEAERIRQNNNIATYEQDIVNRNNWINNAQTVTIPNLQAQQTKQEGELDTLKKDKSSYESTASAFRELASGYYETYSSNVSAQSVYINKRSSLSTQLSAAEKAYNRALANEATACNDDPASTLCSGAKSAVSEAASAKATAERNYNSNETTIASYQPAINSAWNSYSSCIGYASDYDGYASTAASNIKKKEKEIAATKQAIIDTEDDIDTWESDITYRRYTLIPNAKTARDKAIVARDKANASIPALTRAESQAQANLDIELKNVNVFKEIDVIGRQLVLGACELEYNHRKKSAEKALAALQEAEAELLAQQRYRANLLNKYDKYKAEYDIYAEIKAKTGITSDASFLVSKKEKKEVADLMGIYITFRARNAHITINGESLNNGSNAYIEDKIELKLSEAIDQRTELKTPNPQFYQKAYNGVGEKVTEEDYKTAYSIAKTVPNGIRTIAGEAKYKTEILIAKKEGIGPITLYKTAIDTVEDDVYYSNYLTPKQELTNGTFKLDYDGLVTKTSRKVNIYTPIAASATLVSNAYDLVDQSDVASSVQTIQLGVPFTVKLGNTAKEAITPYSGLKNTRQYAAGYYVKFDFDVCNIVVGYYNTASSSTMTKQGWVNSSGTVVTNLKTIKNEVVKAGTWIGPITSASGTKTTAITAQVYSDVTDDTINAAEETRSYTVRAYAYNAPNLVDIYGRSLALYYGDKYDLLIDMLQYRSVVKPTVKNICTDKKTTNAETDVPSYFADTTYELVVLNKLYDFRVTDVKDVAWKSVFRKNTSSAVNEHTGNLYYSGIRKWIYSNIDLTKTQPRTTAELGKDPVRTLPVGPYKHTDKDYVKAPKLGYTFSFDMKVTGAFYDKDGKPLTNKYVDITTKFYYVSKDGKTFIEEAKNGKNGIMLFYKNASGKYVKLEDGASGGYELKFTPNDAYRYVTDKEKISLSKDVVKLGNLRSLRLTHEMATVYQSYDTVNTANNGTIITYYGEYKLPNSTIAVAVDSNGKYDINNPLKDGYIGVIFNITAKAGTYGESSKDITLSYGAATKTYAEINNNRKEADLLKTIDTANTSQWDYEGYLGFKNFGYQANFTAAQSIRLEKGQWAINNTLYKKIKGTVMLYDIDDRAATDYE